jgi:hypothetical protein
MIDFLSWFISKFDRPDERPVCKAKPNVYAISDGKAGAYCTVGIVLHGLDLDLIGYDFW